MTTKPGLRPLEVGAEVAHAAKMVQSHSLPCR